MDSKVCFKCKQEKPISDFYKHHSMKDGRLNKCKDCTKEDVRARRRRDDSVREYDRRRYQENPERRRKNRAACKERYAADPIRAKARYSLNNAVRDGRIDKPDRCSRCNSKERRIEAHHEDYTKPLEVIWLCSLCHRRLDFAK